MRGLVALLFVSVTIALGATACSSSSTSTGTTTGGSTCKAIRLEGDCRTCLQTYCSNQTATCFTDSWAQGPTDGAPCSDYYKCVNSQACGDTCAVSEKCHECSQNQFGPCVAKNCADVCGSL